MSEPTAQKKLNIPKETTCIRLPLDFTGRTEAFKGLSVNAWFILAHIYTMNRISYKKFGLPAKIKYDDIVARFSMSKETVSKYKTILEDKGIIKYLGKSRYSIEPFFNEKDYIVIDDYLHTAVWEMTPEENKNKKRQRKAEKRLTRSATAILAFLTRSNQNPKTDGVFISSQGRIGTALNMPKTTAGDSIREIDAASLCTMTPEPNRLTKYEVIPEVLNVKHVAPKAAPSEEEPSTAETSTPTENQDKPKTRKSKKLDGTALKAAIESHYFELRYKAEYRAEQVIKQAESDSAYNLINKRLKELAIAIPFAELKDPSKAAELNREALKLEAEGDKRLEEIGINKADFTPQYTCRSCNDTGYDSSGRPCDCLLKFIENNQK